MKLVQKKAQEMVMQQIPNTLDSDIVSGMGDFNLGRMPWIIIATGAGMGAWANITDVLKTKKHKNIKHIINIGSFITILIGAYLAYRSEDIIKTEASASKSVKMVAK